MMYFREAVSFDDVIDFAESQGWSVPFPIGWGYVDAYSVKVRIDANTEPIFLVFKKNKITSDKKEIKVSKMTQQRWRQFVKNVYARRKKELVHPQYI